MAGTFTASVIAHDVKRSDGDLLAIKMGITKIWKGDNVVLKTDGYCYSAYSAGAAGDQFVGVAAETKDNRYTNEGDSSSAAAAVGDRRCACWQNGIVERECPAGTVFATDLGLACYCAVGTNDADNPRAVITSTGGKETACGRIVDIVSTYVVRVAISAWGAIEA